tara:strand:+ start:1039 stop:1293 length:255 start_codon:yes stop_codon:yes gene_type:complete
MSMKITLEDNPNLDNMYQINKIERTAYSGEVDGYKFTYFIKSIASPHREFIIWQEEEKVPSRIKDKAMNRVSMLIKHIKKESEE